MKLFNLFATASLGASLTVTGCGGSDAAAAESDSAASESSGVAFSGNVVEVRMVSGRGERFEPANITVKRGDIVRFVLVAGVHNASFAAGKNPGGVNLPAAIPYLQAPGQTHDLTIDLAPGEYHYHCDPHAALGMVGKITVSD